MQVLLILFILSLSIVSACSSTSSQPEPRVLANYIDIQDSALVKQKLLSQYQQWQGVPYQLGGMSQAGIDCSGLIYQTFRQQLGIELPRSTDLQSQLGFKVKIGDLRAGDLIFFKTGFNLRHVGIYIDKGMFLHASSHQGVMLSRLDNIYWREHYWQSLRVSL